MKNKIFEQILEDYKDKSNKDLSEILVVLKNDFDVTKQVVLDLAEMIGEIEVVYDKVYTELQSRLKFKDVETVSEDERTTD
jgi:hypothetical protein